MRRDLPAFSCAAIILCSGGFSQPAHAQRTQENAVTNAGDAFGTSVGGERIGIYSADDVRGFNPIDAGNARIEGLYFDQQERPTPRLIERSTIRVGITAQGYPFPAPTGIVDYRLRPVGGKFSFSVEGESAPYGGIAGSLEAVVPLDGANLGVNLGAGFRNAVTPQGGGVEFRAYAGVLRWHPYARAEVIAFLGGFSNRNDDPAPAFFPAGDVLPPQIERGVNLGQPWTRRFGSNRNYGLIAKLPLGQWLIEAGLIRSHRQADISFSDLFRGVRSDGSAVNHLIVADGNNVDDAVAGELRVRRDWGTGALKHNIQASLRARVKDRAFGGQVGLSLGAGTLLARDIRPKPNYVLGPEDQDRVRQQTLGLSYGFDWAKHGALSATISRTRYSKQIDFTNPAVSDLDARDSPWLFSVNGAVQITSRITVYGGIVRGLEESLIAPENAINRGEAPPAIITDQVEAGLRLLLPRALTLVAGVFSVRKPYFNLDEGLRFGLLGTVQNRGIELSLAGRPLPGLSIVAGTVLLDPKISGDVVMRGDIGPRPVGSLRGRSVLNIDWTPARQTRWSFDAAVESLSSRIGNISNRLTAPPRTILALGFRYRAKLGGVSGLLRVQATNVLNEYGWLVSSGGGFTYSPRRALQVQLVADL